MPELAAFTADNVCRLTGLSARQVGYWAKTGFFSPTLLDEYGRRAFGDSGQEGATNYFNIFYFYGF